MGFRFIVVALALLLGAGIAPAQAQEVIQKQVFEAGTYRTRGGGAIANVRIGYQTMGTLNEARDNAVLIAHFFSGNSHAFGRLAAGGPPGYWDAIIGPGKAIDTNRFFVVSADTPVNLNTRDPNTTTTGPATPHPETGTPWGLRFPVLSIRDFVETQKALLEHLGVKRLALVAGASMGALQTVEWAVSHPGMVARAMPVIGTGEIDPWIVASLDLWAAPIRLDPAWKGDAYHGGPEPVAGLAEALRQVTLVSRHAGWAATLGMKPAEGQDPARSITGTFHIEKWLNDAASARARTADANHFLYLVRANQLFLNEYASSEEALARSQARWLLVPSLTDEVFDIRYNRRFAERLKAAGKPVEVAELDGPLGHLEGVVSMAKVEARVRAFLAD